MGCAPADRDKVEAGGRRIGEYRVTERQKNVKSHARALARCVPPLVRFSHLRYRHRDRVPSFLIIFDRVKITLPLARPNLGLLVCRNGNIVCFHSD
jgi:hypothetical protein